MNLHLLAVQAAGSLRHLDAALRAGWHDARHLLPGRALAAVIAAAALAGLLTGRRA